jgi:hypothetical protein
MLSPQQIARYRGHPTSSGQRDFPGVSPLTGLPTTHANLSVLPQGSDKYTRDGKPGVPRFIAPLPRSYHADPANLGSTSGPKQPGLVYYGEVPHAGFEPWNSRNEKLRRQVIEAAQANGGN